MQRHHARPFSFIIIREMRQCHSAELHLEAEDGENKEMVSFLLALLFLPTSTPVAQQMGHEAIRVQAGEMVALHCPCDVNPTGDAEPIWTSSTEREMDLTDVSSAEETGVLVQGMSLVILRASGNHQGNYSCSLGNSSCQCRFTVTVNTAQSRGNDSSKTCHSQQSCELTCPPVNIRIVNITSNGITWHKEGRLLPNKGYFLSVEENHGGVYICTRSFLYTSQVYNMTFTFVLHVKPKVTKTAVIISPQHEEVFYVDLGSTKVIDCEALACSVFDSLFWLGDKSLTTTKEEPYGEQIKITASLVFKKVSEEDLSKNYTCRLQSTCQNPHSVNITLRTARRSYTPLILSTVGIVVVLTVTLFIYVKLKIEITLFLRDTLGCHRSASDGKSYDAFLMCYESDGGAGLNAQDRKRLESVLEGRFGYSLCLYDRDVLPGEAAAEAVFDCIEESRTVVLVPTSPDPGLGSSLLSAIHAALVERQTHLIFITTETTEVSTPGSLSEALQPLSEAGDCVTWKGQSSMSSSSSFWKQLRYYLPASRQASKINRLPLTI
ncbi:interleukin-18 receptor accessory protein-like isoform X2 [Hippoglossus stenolepis]|uniref:interleukin-18 receptor accessory protein-like isoform X2 n=1 Tax=Hippoglossus stenolepis TaxID=195615 RepID=UPI00159C9E02|nr:interleukin-18 receptor accessory protein-like isoform X2 [Hippoglossus stenolepis]